MSDPQSTRTATTVAISWSALRDEIHGRLILTEDSDYEEARNIWSGMTDKHPAAVARCANVSDVVAVVNFAREHDLLLAVRGGGHSAAGHSTCDGGLVIDLSPMKAISVDPIARTARAEGGVKWVELDAAAQQYGLAVTGGTNSDTGIAGLTLGGGIGWLARTYGYACDNLLAAEVVLADGSCVRASEHEHADLFWGLRGGGGNFGVVTAFEYRLHPTGPLVLSGPIIYPLDQTRELAAFQREFMRTAPDEVSIFNVFVTVPAMEPFPEPLHGQKLLFVVPLYVGSIADGVRALDPLRSAGRPIADAVAPMPYIALQQTFDPVLVRGIHIWSRADYLRELDGPMVVAADYITRAPASQSHIIVAHQGGAIAKLAGGATAFARRDEPYFAWIIGAWPPEQPDEPAIAWVHAASGALQPFATGTTYVNALQEEGDARIRASYTPQVYDRLADVKRTYDPRNLFRLNQNIQP